MADPTARERARAALKRGGLLFSERTDAAVEEVAAAIEAACAAAVEARDRELRSWYDCVELSRLPRQQHPGLAPDERKK